MLLRDEMGFSQRIDNNGSFLLRFLYALLLIASSDIFGVYAVPESTSPNVDNDELYTPAASSPASASTEVASYQQQALLNGNLHYGSEAIENILPHHMFRNKNVAVIMETNPAGVPSLIPIILHFSSTLGPDWPIILLTLQVNWEMPASPDFRQLYEARRVIVLFIPPDTTFPDHTSVTVFMVRPWLWQLFAPANRMLIFQVDSILCSQSPQRVEDFIEWDFIGAPIIKEKGHGYNGGLSIRNPKLFLEIALEQEKNPTELSPEDQWFYGKLLEREAHMPTADQAKFFAVETWWHEKPLGYHQPARWQHAHMPEITEWCPEVKMLDGGQHYF
ncbi:hypothetical protein CkaCkLH20_03592 [Colletotrichum karsti]|uniref:DUF5672 domain-containing protein n=1 Tax=Colletotrichum karsti TaxID=1095194 RepID=A0A9P6IAC6_9PEZI|nr:uncharacterized protein CkaCkLH20_03592 [Colletotrichum karsti]KAF9878692.1 hypothetical protein CkaCkLH20_03592 [Colletotrichum karsti]